MLVENRWYHDQVGYNVLTPFQVPGQQCLLLIDRGWIPKSSVNALKPVVQGIQRVEGLIKSTQEYQFILGDNIMQPQAKPLVMQTINLKAIERVTHACYYPFVLRLDATQPYGYIREWVITAVPYQRHLAYAVQWFLMALILGIAYFLASITSEGTHDNTPI